MSLSVLRGIDVMVFPSLPTGEGMPGVLIEAGLSGVPVVATDVPGVRSIVGDDEGGFVVDADELDAMVDATARLLEDSDLRARLGSAALQRCLARFSLDEVTACWEQIIAPLATAPSGGVPAEVDEEAGPAQRNEGLDFETGARRQRHEVVAGVPVHTHSPGAVADDPQLETKPGAGNDATT